MIEKLKKINNEKYKFDILKTICLYILIYLIASIIGFIYEELFYLIVDKKLVYQGFLYGPYVPVYGLGAIIMLPILKRYKKNPIIIFLGAMLLTGIVEYFTGWLMWTLYHKTWWDYTGLLLNINGYVCLRSVLTFAIGGLLLIYILEPLVCKFLKNKSKKFTKNTSMIIVSMFVIDLILTLLFRYTL